MQTPMVLLSLGLGVYIFAATLVVRHIRAPELRALVYSLPVPMSLVVLARDATVPTGALLGLILLGSFFFVAVFLEAKGCGRVIAISVSLGIYILGSSIANRLDALPQFAAIIAALAWLIPALFILKRRSLRSIFLQRHPASRRASNAELAVVSLVSLGAVLMGSVLEAFLITFPFLGIAVALTYPGNLAAFARSFWIFGIPPLAGFMGILIIAPADERVTIQWTALAISVWALLAGSLALLRMRVISSHLRSRIGAIANVIGEDPGARGIAALQSQTEREGELLRAADAVLKSQRIVLVTGFPIPVGEASIAETDGPVATAILAAYLALIGKQVHIATDATCERVVRAAADAANRYCRGIGLATPQLEVEVQTSLTEGTEPEKSIYVFIERPGRAADGCLYTMRGRELRSVPDLGGILEDHGCTSVGIGDGGNEIGMGSVQERVSTSIEMGRKIACVDATTYLIVAGTSNWGGYGLLGSLESCQRQTTPGTTLASDLMAADQFVLDGIVQCGAIDGRTLEPAPTVDGLSRETYLRPIGVISRTCTS